MATSFQGFRSLVENSPDAISVIDTAGRNIVRQCVYHQNIGLPAGRARGTELPGADPSGRS